MKLRSDEVLGATKENEREIEVHGRLQKENCRNGGSIGKRNNTSNSV